MMLLTPALDLAPITGGRDFVFVLDTSGSMAGKLGTLARGVVRALGELDGEDRFRVVTFSDRARELGRGWTPATPENVEAAVRAVEALAPDGGTHLNAGLSKGFEKLDDDRATSVILVTDGVTNTGVVEPREFYELMKATDVRVFGFLLGNSANWPLMELIADTSGGFYSQVSNQDDILGQILLAKEKVTHEALHDAALHISGVHAFDVTGRVPRKVYRGQQLVLFGRYDGSGQAAVRLDAALTGQDASYATRFDFPAQSDEHPELERLWALARIEELERSMRAGLLEPEEGESAIEALGVAYQIVTDQTSMVVMDDAAFEEHGVERRNRVRVESEREARARRSAQPIRRHHADANDPMFGGRVAPSAGSGAGAFGLLEALGLLAAGGGLAALGRRRS
jgi:Ca-activated chloride channel family protein